MPESQPGTATAVAFAATATVSYGIEWHSVLAASAPVKSPPLPDGAREASVAASMRRAVANVTSRAIFSFAKIALLTGS